MEEVHEELGSVARGLWRDTDFESDLRDAVEPVLTRNAERYGELSSEEFDHLLDRCVEAIQGSAMFPVMNSHTLAESHGISEGDLITMVHGNDETRKSLFEVKRVRNDTKRNPGTEILVSKQGTGPADTPVEDLQGMGDYEEDRLYRSRGLKAGMVVASDRFEVHRNR